MIGVAVARILMYIMFNINILKGNEESKCFFICCSCIIADSM